MRTYRTYDFRHVAAWPKRLLCLQDFFAGQHLVLHGPGGRWSADRYVAFVAARPQALGSQNYILKYFKYYSALRCDRCAIACISWLVVLSNHEVAYWGMFFTYCNSYRRSMATSRPDCVVINICFSYYLLLLSLCTSMNVPTCVNIYICNMYYFFICGEGRPETMISFDHDCDFHRPRKGNGQ